MYTHPVSFKTHLNYCFAWHTKKGIVENAQAALFLTMKVALKQAAFSFLDELFL